MTARKESGSKGLFGGPPEAPAPTALTADQERLLGQLREVGFTGRADGLLEGTLRKREKELHFALRTAFGSYSNALALLLKRELGSPLTRKQLLERLQELYDEGGGITLEGLLEVQVRFTTALLGEFGTLEQGFEELGIDPAVAARDRRWEKETVFNAILEVLGDAIGELSEAELLTGHPLLAATVQHVFGSFSSFHKEFALWLESQPALFLVWGRNQISRLLTRNVPLTSRATKGRSVADMNRVKLVFPAGPGYRLHLLSSSGLLYPVADHEVPFVSFNVGEGGAAQRLPNLGRGEKPVALLSLDDRSSLLAMATEKGRVKVVEVSRIKRVRREGTLVMRVAAEDRITAAGIVAADLARLAVVTRAGRAVAFDREQLKLSSRTSMGHYRLRFDQQRHCEPVSVVGLAPGEDVVLLGRNGNLLRLGADQVPSRKGASLGRRVWQTQVVCATACGRETRLLVATRKGRLLAFWDSQLPRRHALRMGVMGIRLDSDDAPQMVGVLGGERR